MNCNVCVHVIHTKLSELQNRNTHTKMPQTQSLMCIVFVVRFLLSAPVSLLCQLAFFLIMMFPFFSFLPSNIFLSSSDTNTDSQFVYTLLVFLFERCWSLTALRNLKRFSSAITESHKIKKFSVGELWNENKEPGAVVIATNISG